MASDSTGTMPGRVAMRYSAIYAVLASAWILLSDLLMSAALDDLDDVGRVATFKGLAFVLVTALLLLVALKHYARFYHRSESDRALLASQLDCLARYGNDSIALVDTSGRFIDVNDRFLATYGYSREEVLRLNLSDWRPAYLDVGGPGLLQRVLAQGSAVFETESHARDGSMIPVEIGCRMIGAGDDRLIQIIARDITERREAEARILAVSRLYAAISAANQAIMRAANIGEVFDSVCRACVAYGGLRMAWVGLVDEASAYIVPHAFFGKGTGYLEALAVPVSGAAVRDPEAIAFREERGCVCNDFIDDPMAAPWHQRAAFHGFRAAISLPLRRGERCVGTLTAYSASRDRFDDDAVALLQDLAESISFALDNFDRSDQRLRAEAALRLSEIRLLQAQAIGEIGDWSYDLASQQMSWSPQMYRLFERDPAAGPPSHEQALSYFDADDEQTLRAQLRRVAHAGLRGEIEYRVRLPSGKQRNHAGVIVPIKDGAGTVVGIQGTVQDVTARKEVEMRLRHKEAQLKDAQQVARMGSWEWLPEAEGATWSATLYRILGLDAASTVPDSEQLLAMLAPESRDVVREAAERILRTGESYELDIEVVCADGVHRWLTCRGEARRNGEYIVGLLGTVQDVTERRGREAERAARERHMHELSRRLIAAQEDERRRLAAELHDRTSPNLAAVQLTLGNLRLSMPDDVLSALADQFDDLRALLQDATTSIRDVCADLRPALLDYAGLIPALESHIQQFSRRTGILVKLEHRGLGKRLSDETEALLFRIVQEALTNCAKHAQATTIRIALRKGSRRLVLTIVDDGVGFDPAKMGSGDTKPGLGLLTMRERAEFAGGRLSIDSVPGRGTILRVEV